MSNKTLLGLCSAAVFALASADAYGCGAFTHMYIARKSFEKIPDQLIRDTIVNNFDAYLLGANFPDVGLIGTYIHPPSGPVTETLLALSGPIAGGVAVELRLLSSGKNYGEASHWDPFLDAYKRILKEKYHDPITEAPMAFSFLMGVATHRVSDDIWHNRYDPPYNKEGQVPNSYKFKTCDKSKSSSVDAGWSSDCYYGFISKLADLEALNWDGAEEAHTTADRGIDFAILNDKRSDYTMIHGKNWSSIDYPHPTAQNVPFEILVEVFKDPDLKKRELGYNLSDNITAEDIAKDFQGYELIAVKGISAAAGLGALGALQKSHRMDWARDNYETDPDVGLNPIEVHVTDFITELGDSLKVRPSRRPRKQ